MQYLFSNCPFRGYLAWPSIGGAPLDEAGFSNQGTGYILWQNFNHRADQAPALTAGIVVQQDGAERARPASDSGSITPAIHQLRDVFEAAGQCYGRTTSTWAACRYCTA